jgi:hypothetical protein
VVLLICGQYRQALCLLVGLLISIDRLLEAKSRWRQLRSHAGALESIIWRFRTRVGYFASTSHASETHKPEQVLCKELTDWIDELVSSANLGATDLNREYPQHVYKHHQFQDSQTVKRAVRIRIAKAFHSENAEGGEGAAGEASYGDTGTDGGEEELRDLWEYDTHGDDFQAPCKPEDYIQLRLRKAMEFYMHRLR